MCEYPWTNRDVFEFFPTCHIYQPIFIFFNVLNLVGGILNFFNGLYEYKNRIRKDVPLVVTCTGFLFIIDFSICLGANLSFANKNIVLNLIHAFSLCCTSIGITLVIFRHIEVILTIDQHTIVQVSTLRNTYTLINNLILLLNLPITWCSIILPTIIPSILFPEMVGISGVITTALQIGMFLTFAIRVRNIIASMEISRSFYDPIQNQLDKLIIGTFIQLCIGFFLQLSWFLIVPIRQNLYIVYNFVILFGHVSGFQQLNVTKENNVKKEQEQEKKIRVSTLSSHHLLTSETRKDTFNEKNELISNRTSSSQRSGTLDERSGTLEPQLQLPHRNQHEIIKEEEDVTPKVSPSTSPTASFEIPKEEGTESKEVIELPIFNPFQTKEESMQV